jgi:hypothetical protein
MENALLLDAAEYFNNPDLSDVTITIREEALKMPGHKATRFCCHLAARCTRAW